MEDDVGRAAGNRLAQHFQDPLHYTFILDLNTYHLFDGITWTFDPLLFEGVLESPPRRNALPNQVPPNGTDGKSVPPFQAPSKMNLSLYSVNAFVILDSEGHRVLAKYYRPKDLQSQKDQRAFEKGLWQKTKKPGGTTRVLHPPVVLTRILSRRRDPL